MLDKKAVLIRLEIKTICLTKNFFRIVIKITVFFLINSGNQESIDHIHCFGHIFWSLLWILLIECLIHLLFNNTSLCLLWLIVATTFLFTPFALWCSLLLSIKNKIHFWLQPNKLFNRNASGFIFHFCND